MTCHTCLQAITAYIDDEATPEVRAEVDAHLATCDACRKEYEADLALWEAARDVPIGTPGDGLWSAIQSKVHTRSAGTDIEDLAVIVRGLAEEVRDLKHTVELLRQDLDTRASEPESDVLPRYQRLRIWRETPGRTEAAS